jgi:hypothetical protein
MCKTTNIGLANNSVKVINIKLRIATAKIEEQTC